MSKEIDHKIVEMRFNNKQFEANTKQSMGTLSKLKEALKLPDTGKALEGIDKATKNISLDGIASGVEALNKRFSTLGIVGMRAIENITDGLMGKLNTAVNFVTDSIVSGGIKRAMNIENAHFQLQALLKDEEKVQAVMADAMESVDGTAYAYDEAAKAASQFAASGLQAGDEMLGALKGITGVAAMTNSSFEDTSNIFTTVAGNGRLMGDQLLQLSSRGLNAASTLADYFREVRGQAGMTEATIREMVSDGEISFKDFSDAMTWAFGDSAKRANETFTGAMSNMKSALARIGAGFISPLVEQNGELVQLFNALRIKINDVKTALVFDEQTSAISGMADKSNLLVDSIGSLTRDGSIGFNTFTDAIIGSSDTLENYDEINDRISKSFESVKNSGTLTSEALNEFNESGLHATSSLMAFVNGVNSGSIKVKNTTKQMVKDLTNGTRVMESDIEQLVKEGKINFEVFSSAIVNTSGVTKKQTDFMSTAFKGLFDSVKKEGHLTTEIYSDLSQSGFNAGETLTEYMNGVADGTIRASYATRQTIEELRKDTELTTTDIWNMVKEGQITFDIFQSAMEHSFGNMKPLSKQFTDSFLDMIKSIVKAINEADMTTPMEIFYYWVESVKNVLKGLYSILKPIGKAFADVFLSFETDEVINFSSAVETLTSKMKLSEKGSKNLHDAMTGLFSVVKLVVDIFFKLLGAIIPIQNPVGELGDGFLGLIGAMGRSLESFTDMIRSCELLNTAFDVLSSGFSLAMDGLTNLIKIANEFIYAITGLEGTEKLINSINNAFVRLSEKATPYIKDFISQADNMFKTMFNFEDVNLDQVLEEISKAFSDLAFEIDNFSLKTLEDALNGLKKQIKDLWDVAMTNEGFATFVTNFIKYGEELKEAFTLDNLLDRLEKVMEIFGKFFNWIKEVFGPAFKDFNVGSVAATGGGLGIIYAMIKAAKAFENISKTVGSLPDFLNGVKGVLVAYQKQLKAEALLTTAAAIAVLAGALVLLSFADTERILEASLALSLIATALMGGISLFLNAVNKGKELNTALITLSKGLSSTMKKFGRAMEIKALGGAIKKFAESVAIIAVAIIALGIMYKKDKDALMAGVELVKMITLAMVGIMAGMSILGNILKGGGMKNFSAAALGILSLSASLTLCVNALKKLFKMEFPSDWEFRVKLLAGMLAGLGVLALALGSASRIAGKNKMSSLMILSVAALLMTTVASLDKLFKMEFPSDWEEKMFILTAIFVEIGALMIAMGAAAKLAGGTIKAAGSILAMSIFIAVIVGALMVLTLIPTEKLIRGATALGIVLTTLGVALYGAGNITTKETYKTVLAMAIVVGTITAALSVLAMVPVSKLLKSSIALGSILLVLAENFKQIGTIVKKKVWMTVAAMVAAVLSIALSLYVLSEQPWDGLLAASVSLSAVLLAFGQTLKMISNMEDLNLEKIGLFLLATTSLIPIGAALYLLSEQPWDGMVAAAITMSAVLLAFGQTLKMISNMEDLNLEKIGLFLLATTSLIPIGIALYELSTQPWDGMLAAGAALSGTLLAMGVAFGIVSKSRPDLTAIGAFLAASISVGLIAFAIYELSDKPWQDLLGAAASLSLVLLSMSGAMAICSSAGAVAPAALIGIGLLDLFIANFALLLVALGAIFKSEGAKALMSGGAEILIQIGNAIGGFVGAIVNGLLTGISSALPKIGEDLSDFMVNLTPFIEGSKNIDANALKSVGYLAAMILALTGAELINGIAKLFGLSLVDIATELSDFMLELKPFVNNSKDLNADTMKACLYLAEMILALTGAELIAGISKFLGLSGSIGQFGEDLKAFGPSIRDFADCVKDVKPEAVQGAASAAEIMANMADKLPGSGGLAQKIFGEKSLAEFGKELVAFGPSIKRFGEMVKDVKPEAVQGASEAAEIMANMADKLPAQDGLINKIFGERSLAEFGKELTSFGPSIVKFSDMVKDIDPASVAGAAAATTIMSTLADQLPSSETLWDKIFGGGQTSLSEFGKEMVKFGTYMTKFSESVSGIDTENVNNAVSSFKQLVNLANYAEGASAKDIVNFSKELEKMGTNAVTKFVQTFSDGGPKASKAVASLCKTVISTLKSEGVKIKTTGTTVGNDLCIGLQSGITQKQPSVITAEVRLATAMIDTLRTKLPINTFKTIGQNVVQGLINGINAKKPTALSTAKTLCTSITSTIRSSLPSSTFKTIGQNVVQGLINGINAKKSTALSAVKTLCSDIIDKFKDKLSSDTFQTLGEKVVNWLIKGMNSKKSDAKSKAVDICNAIIKAFTDNLTSSKFESIGANAALGLKKGIESKIDEIAKAAIEASKKAVSAAKEALKVKSPSKVFFEIGQFVSIGLANGIKDNIRIISKAATEAANKTIEPVEDATNDVLKYFNSSDLNLDPVIRPIIDLTDVENGLNEINALMNKRFDLSTAYENAMSAAKSFETKRNPSNVSQSTDGDISGNVQYFTFTQNNTSPKALDASEIYRQTKNQFSLLKKGVGIS